ncbi:MAG: DUF485 domain-containing protein [Actinobacteria bacterium]|nr:DUF485 domain-containing protein [Actinomycetota bacterium]
MPQEHDLEHGRYYRGMVDARRKLVWPLVISTVVFFFLQQVLTNFTSALDGIPFTGMSAAYLYAFAQFFFAVILTSIYRSRMRRFERELEPYKPTHALAVDGGGHL